MPSIKVCDADDVYTNLYTFVMKANNWLPGKKIIGYMAVVSVHDPTCMSACKVGMTAHTTVVLILLLQIVTKLDCCIVKLQNAALTLTTI